VITAVFIERLGHAGSASSPHKVLSAMHSRLGGHAEVKR
jgi:hypothetical protein